VRYPAPITDGIGFEFFSEGNSGFLMTNVPRRLDDRASAFCSTFIRRNGDIKIRSSRGEARQRSDRDVLEFILN
jgi:hypothetical protein